MWQVWGGGARTSSSVTAVASAGQWQSPLKAITACEPVRSRDHGAEFGMSVVASVDPAGCRVTDAHWLESTI